MGADASPGRTTVALLGPLEVRRDGAPVGLGGLKPRAILACLAARPGSVVASDELLRAVWGDDPADGARASLQVHVSNLRKAIGPDLIVTRAPGYVLEVAPSEVDHTAAAAEVREAREARRRGDLDEAAELARRAVGRWRGPALADVRDAPFAEATAIWLDEQRLLAVEELAEVDLARGEHRALVGRLEAEVAENPYREALWGLLMTALYRSDRQADALGAYQRARHALGEGLGVEPGRTLRDLEAAILAQDPTLDVAAVAAPPPAAGANATVPAWSGGSRSLSLDGREVAIDGLITLGRIPECTVSLDGAAVSRRHAEVRPTVAGDLLVDLGSTNGTLVNGAPISAHVLTDGDEVTIGDHLLRYHQRS